MDMETIIRDVNEVFVEEFELDESQLKPEAQIFQELGLDSLDIVDLIVAVQKKFGVNVRTDERVQQIRTLQDLYEFIATLKNEME